MRSRAGRRASARSLRPGRPFRMADIETRSTTVRAPEHGPCLAAALSSVDRLEPSPAYTERRGGLCQDGGGGGATCRVGGDPARPRGRQGSIRGLHRGLLRESSCAGVHLARVFDAATSAGLPISDGNAPVAFAAPVSSPTVFTLPARTTIRGAIATRSVRARVPDPHTGRYTIRTRCAAGADP